jgi:hypothetical protein
MIELVIAACLVAGDDCRDFRLLYDARDVSLMTCMVAGQAQVAQWNGENPAWEVRRWSCGVVRAGVAEL